MAARAGDAAFTDMFGALHLKPDFKSILAPGPKLCWCIPQWLRLIFLMETSSKWNHFSLLRYSLRDQAGLLPPTSTAIPLLPSRPSLKFPPLLGSWWHSKDTVPARTCGVTTMQCSQVLGRQAEGWRCGSVGTPGIQGSLPSNLLCAKEGLAIPRVLAKTDKFLSLLSVRGAQALLRNRAISSRFGKAVGLLSKISVPKT